MLEADYMETRPEPLDLDLVLQIQKSGHTLHKASEDLVSSTIGKYLFSYLFNSPGQSCVSKNI